MKISVALFMQKLAILSTEYKLIVSSRNENLLSQPFFVMRVFVVQFLLALIICHLLLQNLTIHLKVTAFILVTVH